MSSLFDANPVSYINSLLRYYMHIQYPEKMGDDEWTETLYHLLDIRRLESGSK